MRRRSFLATAVGVTLGTATTQSTTDTKTGEQESLYRVQLHYTDRLDEVVIVRADSEMDAFAHAAEWTPYDIGNEHNVYATILSEMDAWTVDRLYDAGYVYAATESVFRYTDLRDVYA